MKKWSKLQKELYLIIDPKIDFQIHCVVYPMRGDRATSPCPRYWITIGKEIIFDYPKEFTDKKHYPIIMNLYLSKPIIHITAMRP